MRHSAILPALLALLCAASGARAGGPADDIKATFARLRASAESGSVAGSAVPMIPTAPAERYSFPAGLVQVYDSTYPMEPPYCARYKNGAKTLVFLAAKHGPDSIPAVQGMFKTEPLPQLAIVEMDDGQVQDKKVNEELASKSEPQQTAVLAGQKGIPVWGGEPAPKELLAAVLDAGYAVKDFELFYIVRTLLGGRRGERIPKIVEEFQQEFGITDLGQLFDEAEFRRYYRAKNGKEFDAAKLEENETWPAQGATLFTRKVAAATSTLRNVRIGGRIADALDKNDRVLVVYGAGHQVEMGKALEQMLGKPKIEKCSSGP